MRNYKCTLPCLRSLCLTDFWPDFISNPEITVFPVQSSQFSLVKVQIRSFFHSVSVSNLHTGD